MVTSLTLLVALDQGKGQNITTQEGTNLLNNADFRQIVYREHLLSVSLKNADLEEVMREISHTCGLKVGFMGPLKEKVTLEFVNLPLEQGLKRLLKNQNYSFFYSTRRAPGQKKGMNALERVKLMGKAGSGQTGTGNRYISASFKAERIKKSSPDQDIDLGIPADQILDLLSQTPQSKEEILELLTESIGGSLNEARSQLLKVIEEFGKKGNADLKALEMLLKVPPEERKK